MRLSRLAAVLAVASSLSFGQLTVDQKIADFQHLSGLLIKGYGPYEWKKQILHFDLADTEPWEVKIRVTKNDAEFYELMVEYVASLDDGHTVYENWSSFFATLNFSVDFYDEKLLVDSIDRNRLVADQYPFTFGYELVSIDGQDPLALVEKFGKYNAAANIRTRRRGAAAMITFRPQWVMIDAPSVPEISTVVFRRFDGRTETYRIPWTRNGLALTGTGKLPYPQARMNSGEVSLDDPDRADDAGYMMPFRQLWNMRMSSKHAVRNVVGVGARSPVYAAGLPVNFVQRLGRVSTDVFFSGIWQTEGQRLGLIRIPDFGPADLNAAVTQFQREIAFMQENTDGLILDVTRNPGGSADYLDLLLAFVHHYPYRPMFLQVRATSTAIESFANSLDQARAQQAPASVLAGLQDTLTALQEANRENRGMTKPIPWDGYSTLTQPIRDSRNNLLSYSKPIMVLTDEMSASAADAFAAVIQDSGRGPIFGYRTMGLGGNNTGFRAGSYSEGFLSLNQTLMVRATERAEEGYPVTAYIENVGVRPDIEYDAMTRDNLVQRGKPFVDAFTQAMVGWINKNR